jgi:hypothetical protein
MKPAVHRASIDETDALTDGRVALHLRAAFRTLVQLFPSTFGRFVFWHKTLGSAGFYGVLPGSPGFFRFHRVLHGPVFSESPKNLAEPGGTRTLENAVEPCRTL